MYTYVPTDVPYRMLRNVIPNTVWIYVQCNRITLHRFWTYIQCMKVEPFKTRSWILTNGFWPAEQKWSSLKVLLYPGMYGIFCSRTWLWLSTVASATGRPVFVALYRDAWRGRLFMAAAISAAPAWPSLIAHLLHERPLVVPLLH